ncbi:MAG TPA: DUF3500 domain-containing protein [Candidatus Limnocylindria bacterium]|nr:DUF3500 domain-containing protein [Candidatus Limnocylindria bacterium]
MKPTLLIPLFAFIFATVCRAHVAGDEMAASANKFLAALTPEQRATATFEFKDEERSNWHFVPKVRKGLTLQKMNPEQRALAHALLSSGLSAHGYQKATNIMSLEGVLKELEGPRGAMVRDGELYYFTIFGKPESSGTWGWRVEGHHFSANFTVVKGELFSGTPSFMGTNPAEVRKGPRQGLRVLAEDEDLGRALVKALSDEQRQTAIFDKTAPKEVITSNRQKVMPLETVGIAAAKLTKEQTAQLKDVVKAYVNRLRGELAEADLAKIDKAGWDKVYFAWAGGIEKGEPHYYRVQGPTFLIEYDNTQNDANHVHAVWRDFNNDFGEDLLRKHYAEVPHK